VDVQIKNIKPSVFEYDDYRRYLNDLYVYYKQETSYFSYRYFSKRAGFKSPNFLKLVIDDNRNLTEESAEKTIKAFKLSKSEAAHFKHLVFFCQAKTMKSKVVFAKSMAKSKMISETYSLKQTQLKYYSNWYYIPIRELIGTSVFVEDSGWISEQFNGELKEKEITEAIEDLLMLGLIERNEQGKLEVTYDNISTASDRLSSSLIVNYHMDMIDKGGESIADYSSEHREVSSTCISCSEGSVVEFKKLIRDFRKDILTLAQKDSVADKIYQFNFQLFPIAGVKKRGSK